MTEPLRDTWHRRDLPALRAIVQTLDENPGWGAEADKIVEQHGFDESDFMRAVQALENGGYVKADWSVTYGTTELTTIESCSRAAYEVTGAWPTSDIAADRLLAALKNLADGGRTEDVRSRARKALDALSGAGRDIAVGVATATIGGALQ